MLLEFRELVGVLPFQNTSQWKYDFYCNETCILKKRLVNLAKDSKAHQVLFHSSERFIEKCNLLNAKGIFHRCDELVGSETYAATLWKSNLSASWRRYDGDGETSGFFNLLEIFRSASNPLWQQKFRLWHDFSPPSLRCDRFYP